VKGGIEIESGCLVYSYHVKDTAGKGQTEVFVDAGDGKILKQEKEGALRAAAEKPVDKTKELAGKTKEATTGSRRPTRPCVESNAVRPEKGRLRAAFFFQTLEREREAVADGEERHVDALVAVQRVVQRAHRRVSSSWRARPRPSRSSSVLSKRDDAAAAHELQARS
jgi:hypothetical protein